MKHNIKITLILLAMFLITQLIGIAVINAYSPKIKTVYNQTTGQYENITEKKVLPYGMEPPEMKPEVSLMSIIIAMIVAIILIFLLMRIKATVFIRIWFFIVVIIALSITLNSIYSFSYSSIIAAIIAIPLSFYKIFKRNIIIHNITELLIYPGIAAVFVPILSLWAVILLLILISVYDIYAVWHSGFMQKMAKFQINQLKVFTGFFLPYADKKTKRKIELLKGKYQNKKIPEKALKKSNLKVSLAILGGGDVVFPIMMAGVVFNTLGLIPSLFISVFATLALLFLFIRSEKGKFYPAMPFITAGCLFGLLLAYLLF